MHRIHVLIEPERLDPEGLREFLDTDGCGSVVSFVGLTRADDDGVAVERLEFDAWEERLPGVLNDLCRCCLVFECGALWTSQPAAYPNVCCLQQILDRFRIGEKIFPVYVDVWRKNSVNYCSLCAWYNT